MLLNKIVNHRLFFYLMDPQRFEQALIANTGSFDVQLSSETIAQLSAFYSLLTKWNDRLHLVAPCSPEEFAIRHVLESLVLLKHLPQDAKIADVGSGAGLPIIPCLVVRHDLRATLIESSPKKSVFLRQALHNAGRTATVVARPFEEIVAPDVAFVSCRALDQFTNKVLALIEWAPAGSTLLLFGGEALRQRLEGFECQQLLIPRSEQRFLFLVRR
jgi:16S rRNA (guanine527-N7)-methyltransferase